MVGAYIPLTTRERRLLAKALVVTHGREDGTFSTEVLELLQKIEVTQPLSESKQKGSN